METHESCRKHRTEQKSITLYEKENACVVNSDI